MSLRSVPRDLKPERSFNSYTARPRLCCVTKTRARDGRASSHTDARLERGDIHRLSCKSSARAGRDHLHGFIRRGSFLCYFVRGWPLKFSRALGISRYDCDLFPDAFMAGADVRILSVRRRDCAR